MEVKAAEFARMAGVSRMAISGKIKNGTLILNSGGKLDTDNPLNRAYLEKHKEKQKIALQEQELTRLAESANFAKTAHANHSANFAQPLHTTSTSPITATSPAATSTAPFSATASHTSNLPSKPQTAALYQTPAVYQPQTKAATMLGMTIQELITTYGDTKGIADYAKILRDLTAADEREQKTQERRMLQIPKDFVIARLFSFIDQLTNKLLDIPEAVSDQIIALALSADENTRRQAVINILSDNLTRCIGGCKEHIVNELNSLKGKYDKTEDDTATSIAELTDKLDQLQNSR